MCACVRASFLLPGRGFVQCTCTRLCFGCRKTSRRFSTFSTSVFFFNRPFSTFKSTQMFCCLPFIHVTVFILSLLSHRAVSTNDRAPNVDTLCKCCPFVWRQWLGKRPVTFRTRRCSDVGDVTDMPSAGKCSLNVALECRSPRK